MREKCATPIYYGKYVTPTTFVLNDALIPRRLVADIRVAYRWQVYRFSLRWDSPTIPGLLARRENVDAEYSVKSENRISLCDIRYARVITLPRLYAELGEFFEIRGDSAVFPPRRSAAEYSDPHNATHQQRIFAPLSGLALKTRQGLRFGYASNTFRRIGQGRRLATYTGSAVRGTSGPDGRYRLGRNYFSRNHRRSSSIRARLAGASIIQHKGVSRQGAMINFRRPPVARQEFSVSIIGEGAHVTRRAGGIMDGRAFSLWIWRFKIIPTAAGDNSTTQISGGVYADYIRCGI